MVKVLLDTCAISELRKPHCQESVAEAISQLETENLYISVITMGELTKGIGLLESGRRKSELQSWMRFLSRNYKDRIIDISQETAYIWGDITAKARMSGFNLPTSDGLIAATALQHGLYIMTRNISDFIHSGAMLINPWDK